ncbi:MAG: acetoacetate decarboxylase family protein [Pseudomonadota bacterium]
MNDNTHSHHSAPPPWQLHGNGYIQLFKADPQWLMDHGFIPESMKEHYIPGTGVVMWVDYADSAVGPYRELLFIPGRFRFDHNGFRGSRYMITKIYVSSQASVDGGRANWGIPKELADFSITDEDTRRQRIQVSQDDQLIAESLFERGRICAPVTTALVPAALGSVAQWRNDDLVLTAPAASGRMQRARVVESHFAPKHFPDINNARVKSGLCTASRQFKMTFPVPRVYPQG